MSLGVHSPLVQRERTMRYTHLDTEWPDFDPPLAIASAEEIALAEELRRALERRYLGGASLNLDGTLTSHALEWDDPCD
jgi:hypothetical protein